MKRVDYGSVALECNKSQQENSRVGEEPRGILVGTEDAEDASSHLALRRERKKELLREHNQREADAEVSHCHVEDEIVGEVVHRSCSDHCQTDKAVANDTEESQYHLNDEESCRRFVVDKDLGIIYFLPMQCLHGWFLIMCRC